MPICRRSVMPVPARVLLPCRRALRCSPALRAAPDAAAAAERPVAVGLGDGRGDARPAARDACRPPAKAPSRRRCRAQLKQALDAALAEARKAAQARPGRGPAPATSRSTRATPRRAADHGWQGSAELVVEGRDTQAIAQLTGRIKTLTIARVGYALSREAREKVEADVAAQAIARFRARRPSVSQAVRLRQLHAARGAGRHAKRAAVCRRRR